MWKIVILSVLLVVEVGGEKVDLVVEHSFGSKFQKAGVIKGQIRKDGYPTGQWILERDPISTAAKKQFSEAVKNDGFYMIRFPLKAAENQMVQAFTKARCLAGSNFQEEIHIHADIKANFLGFEYHLENQNCSVTSIDESQIEFSTESAVSFKRPRLAMDLNREQLFRNQEDLIVQDAMRVDPKQEQQQQQQQQQQEGGSKEGEEGEKKPPEEEKSWWQKNWWFIIILGVLYMQVMNSVGGGGQQGQGQQAGAAAGGRRR